MNQSQRGFTLIELLVVLVIITLLAGTVGPKLFNKLGSSKVKIAKNQIELLVSALDTYRLDMGHYPSKEQGLQALQIAPANAPNWEGPYLERIPLDPWDQPYHYQIPGKNQGFALFSYGADVQAGGEGSNADIGYF
jgi:general secretion pathway protein G